MPEIYDNIEKIFVDALHIHLPGAERADFCVGYFNLRGWKEIASHIDEWEEDSGKHCRVLIGMNKKPEEEFREAMRLEIRTGKIDQGTAIQLKKSCAESFKEQLTIGVPTNEDELALQQLAKQMRAGKVVVKLFLRHPLHAKLYLIHRIDNATPILGFLGSSNLTLSGLMNQGELNTAVFEPDAAVKLAQWFEDRWKDRWCLDITEELVEIIEESWATERVVTPYEIYVKMAYHLSQEARSGISEFRLPRIFEETLFDFQKAAVKIAARHLNRRGGVLIGDVVGLGKSLMATALARIFEDDFGYSTLIICPKNLENMWRQEYVERYELRAKVLSITRVMDELPSLRRYQLVIIDESHNLRNREGKRYQAIFEYIHENDSRCILLSATPYNKTYLDLSSQIRLFLAEDERLSIRPERYLQAIGGELEFQRKHQTGSDTLQAFEKSEFPDDWRELMRLFMVRRTRSFIKQNYAFTDEVSGRKYLEFFDGTRSYFPDRIPKTLKFTIDDRDPGDQYAKLYSDAVVDIINNLNLPRYGLGNYINDRKLKDVSKEEALQADNLSRAGKRLMGFCRTNLFKRLESSGEVFLQSIKRHILRNYIFLYALENGLDLPIGTQDAAMLDTRFEDEDVDVEEFFGGEEDNFSESDLVDIDRLWSITTLSKQAAGIYDLYQTQYRKRFKWLRSDLFRKSLSRDLASDAESLIELVNLCGSWDPGRDAKLHELMQLLSAIPEDRKVIVFSQFADTVRYLEKQLQDNGFTRVMGVTGDSPDPAALAHRFSPISNQKIIHPDEELNILIATDVLSEGQNLQDCAIVLNYDLPWAIIRLIQRAGRVDRIGQQAENLYCFTFLPADGVEKIIRLRSRLTQRLTENAEVVGTDEAFFEDTASGEMIWNLYNEKSGVLDDEEDDEVDLVSYALQIWQNAIAMDPSLKQRIPDLSPVSYSAKHHIPNPAAPAGALVYMKTAYGIDRLTWMDQEGKVFNEGQFAVLNAARCEPDTPAVPRDEDHHEIVRAAVTHALEMEKTASGGQLGSARSARFLVYEKLMKFIDDEKKSILWPAWEARGLPQALTDIFKFPLRSTAKDQLNRQLRSNISLDDLADMVICMRDEERLCIISEVSPDEQDPQIVCSLGLAQGDR